MIEITQNSKKVEIKTKGTYVLLLNKSAHGLP